MACVCENVDVGVGNITHFPTNSVQWKASCVVNGWPNLAGGIDPSAEQL